MYITLSYVNCYTVPEESDHSNKIILNMSNLTIVEGMWMNMYPGMLEGGSFSPLLDSVFSHLLP